MKSCHNCFWSDKPYCLHKDVAHDDAPTISWDFLYPAIWESDKIANANVCGEEHLLWKERKTFVEKVREWIGM
jgi:hypothetical protein